MKSSAYPSFTALGSHILRQRFVSVEAHIALMTLPSRPLPHRSDAGVGCRNHGANADFFAVTLGHRLNSSSVILPSQYPAPRRTLMAFKIGFTQCIAPLMNTRITIDNAGRVAPPKSLRDKLGLGPGDSLEVESAGDQITLRPVRVTTPLTKENGVWVFRTGQPLAAADTDAALRQVREDRDRHNLNSKA